MATRNLKGPQPPGAVLHQGCSEWPEWGKLTPSLIRTRGRLKVRKQPFALAKCIIWKAGAVRQSEHCPESGTTILERRRGRSQIGPGRCADRLSIKGAYAAEVCGQRRSKNCVALPLIALVNRARLLR